MGISLHASRVTLPVCAQPYPTILSFLSERFSRISRTEWQRRIAEGKVLDEESLPITADTAYAPHRRIFYFREVFDEAVIPFAEEILFQDEELLVACKPHFLPVTPGGKYVDECLLNRLRRRTGIRDLAPLHRIDRETAGIVLFSVNKKSCARYGELFQTGRVEKTYQAISATVPDAGTTAWMDAVRPGPCPAAATPSSPPCSRTVP
jgi:tRNA pseudouridine32 synthase/23S rRNA pseudouridine746 synthase